MTMWQLLFLLIAQLFFVPMGKCRLLSQDLSAHSESELYCRNWSPLEDEGIIYSCAGGKARLLWKAELEESDQMTRITWTFHGPHPVQIIAEYTPEKFLVSGDYTNRLEQVGTTGIVLNQLTSQDNGNYSVEVQGLDVSGLSFVMRRAAVLQIEDGLMAEGGKLSVTQLAEKDSSDRWSVALACGHFPRLRGAPPFTVEWTTSSGEKLPSSRYDEERKSFILLVPSPVREGSYTCTIPTPCAPDVCASPADIQAGRLSDTIQVDETKARITLLEMQLSSVLQDYGVLKDHGVQLQSQIVSLQTHVSEQKSEIASLSNLTSDQKSEFASLNTLISEQTSEMASLETGNVSTTSVVDSLNEMRASQKRIEAHLNTSVAFMAKIKRTKAQQPKQRVTFTDVKYNQGDGYRSDSGEFTAPFSGTYCFFMKTESMVGKISGLWMKKNGVYLLRIYAHDKRTYEGAGGTVVTPLEKGDKVWVDIDDWNYSVFHNMTSFGGFLLHADFSLH